MKSNEVGVFIKGLKMPPSCCDCDMIELSGAIGCRHAYDMKNSDLDRASDCPLVPVPPHGRLIDADALMHEFEKAQRTMQQHGQEYSCSFMSSSQEISTEWYCVEDMLDNAPTAIPAEEAEDA